MIDIILVEDHKIVRNGVKSLLEKEPKFKIVGEAVSGNDVLTILNSGTKADIILADINMPGLSGLELIAELKKAGYNAKIIMLTMLDHERYVAKAFKAGANGYLLKNTSPDELIFAIKHIYADGNYLFSELAMRLLDRLSQGRDIMILDNRSDVDFSKRETEVLTLIAEGFTNQEIADKLFTSKRTIEGHRQSMIDKTGTRNTAALIRFALLNGIIS
ncbi:response regulator transcription factor [Mucilaginibacter jinjuensis]|uniref:Response regulator transcription factor n=1 Tax=Mucilaginibacter jinjuensis TaxID=1176721 RepID=A0ABY7T868_9SPHI|nr:response regulator transcription factor [Mucilaginibacter jinjuensis]WCT12551.1 response regulator transcription factor [Mucilaginibacter jinjuensis]